MALTDKLTAIADSVRSKTGGASLLTLDEIARVIDGWQPGVDIGDLTFTVLVGGEKVNLDEFGYFKAAGSGEYFDAIYVNGEQVWTIKPVTYELLPRTAPGYIPMYAFPCKAGDVFVFTYYLTKSQGYLWDARSCGGGYNIGNHPVGVETTERFECPSDGILVTSSFHSPQQGITNGAYPTGTDGLYGNYVYVQHIPASAEVE